MKRYALIALLAAACSEPTGGTQSNNGEACPAGEARNPVTGACEANGGSDTGGSPIVVSDASGNNNGAPDVGEPPVDQGTPAKPDVATTPDLGMPDLSNPQPLVTRFVAIGDTGTGTDTQRQVGQSIGTVCTSLGGCDFGVLLGDNFYQSGVGSVDDSLFTTMFVEPYGHLGFPFYVVLGNHDLGGDGLGIDLDQNKADYQIEYGQMNPQWVMPARYYDVTHGNVWIVGLDTTDIFFGRDGNQRTDVPTWFGNAGTNWKIAIGHHPYLSNGPHGNAGEYEGLPFIPIANGEHVRDFMEDVVCGNFDFYLCGHDHSRQDIVETCNGTQLIVSGAGAKTTELEGDNATHFQADTEGFVIMEASTTTMNIAFYDAAGTLEHSRMVTR